VTAPWHFSIVCWWKGHGTPIWKFSAKGIGFECPDCGRFRVSPVLKELAQSDSGATTR